MAGESDPENDYAGTPYWVPVEHPRPGFRGIFPTAEEDFLEPTPEEEGWGLI